MVKVRLRRKLIGLRKFWLVLQPQTQQVFQTAFVSAIFRYYLFAPMMAEIISATETQYLFT